jgi:hypothetical protein
MIAKPITELLKKGNKYVWSDACDEAFENLKKLLTASPMLAQPDIAKPGRGLNARRMSDIILLMTTKAP